MPALDGLFAIDFVQARQLLCTAIVKRLLGQTATEKGRKDHVEELRGIERVEQ
jgi:hypothetical protein